MRAMSSMKILDDILSSVVTLMDLFPLTRISYLSSDTSRSVGLAIPERPVVAILAKAGKVAFDDIESIQCLDIINRIQVELYGGL